MLTVRVQPIRRDLEVLVNDALAPDALAGKQAAYARQVLGEAKATNARALGSVPPYETFVDGVEGANELSVKPTGRIVYQFELVGDLMADAIEMLQQYSPVRSGAYANSHEVFADGVQVENPNDPPVAKEYVIMNLRPYARKIEGTIRSGGDRPPQSRQAPNGVYNVVASLLSKRYGNIARVNFSYRAALGGSILTGRAGDRSSERNPAIIVTPR